MNVIKRDVYLKEFKNFTFKQRIYYVWANEIEVGGFNINKNPLEMCILDLIKIISVPILYCLLVPLVIFPVSLFLAYELKNKHKESDGTWFKSKVWILED